jgi:hypothetical protein
MFRLAALFTLVGSVILLRWIRRSIEEELAIEEQRLSL